MMSVKRLKVDKRQPTPAYLQLSERLSKAIADGSLGAGEALPSERDLAELLGLSRMTVRRAFGELISDNLVQRRQGSGTYVQPRRLEQTFDRVLGFTDEARSLGFTAGSKLLEALFVNADQQVAEALDVGKGQEVLRVTRLRTADGEPLALQVAHLAPWLSPFPLETLETAGEGSGSLYRLIAAHFGVTPCGARQAVSARMPARFESRLLELAPNIPLLALERTTFDAQGRPFEFARSAYRSDRYQLALNLRA